MSVKRVIQERRVLPRVRPPSALLASGERAGFQGPRPVVDNASLWLGRLNAAFKATPNEGTAMELVATADMLSESAVATDALAWLRKHSATTGARVIAGVEGSQQGTIVADWRIRDRDDARRRMSAVRRHLRKHESDALAWAELARLHLSTGEADKAKRAMSVALAIAGPNRFLYRTACRVFIHADDAEGALGIVRSHPGVLQDPWLLASEIATCSVLDKASPHISRGMSLLADRNLSARHRSELAASIATVEQVNGRHRAARKLYEESLKDPNENVLAQVEWARQSDRQLHLKPSEIVRPAMYEACTHRSYLTKDWTGILDHASAWLADEPYSTRPAQIYTYIGTTGLAGTMRDCVDVASRGLDANPGDPMLHNNRAVCRAYDGDIQDALSDLECAALGTGDDDDRLCMLATAGLIGFRANLPELANQCYDTALEHFIELKKPSQACRGTLFFVRELARYAPKEAEQLLDHVDRVLPRITQHDDQELIAMSEQVRKELKQATEQLHRKAEPEVERRLGACAQRLEKLIGPIKTGLHKPTRSMAWLELVH